MSDVPIFFKGEVQFAGYSDSSRSGPRITLRLDDRDNLQSFVGQEAKRYMMVLVEIGADEQPVPQAPPAAQPAQRERMGPLCHWAVMRCGDERFRDWVRMEFCSALDPDLTAEQCGDVLKGVAGVASRKDLDTDKAAGALFREVVMQRYGHWLQTQGVDA